MDVRAAARGEAPGPARSDAAPGLPAPAAVTPTLDPSSPPQRSIAHEHGSTRHDLLIALRRYGPASPDGLARLLGISRTAILQQLRVLAASGLVERQAVRHGVGRPRHLYDVTPDARTHFPAHYDSLATTVLHAVRAIGGETLLAHVLDKRRDAQARTIRERFAARNLTSAPLLGRVRELAAIQDEQGYLCDLSESGGTDGAPCAQPDTAQPSGGASVPIQDAADRAGGTLRLHEHNCPIFRVAEAMPAVCDAEAQLFRDILGVRVTRETHIMAGSRCCTFRIEASG